MMNEERVLKNVEGKCRVVVGDVGSRNFRGMTGEKHEESQNARPASSRT